jgi:membrane-associated protease RseP (regulator of RpoE activity)
VSVESRLRLTQVGLILVLGLMVLAFANDIMRLAGI